MFSDEACFHLFGKVNHHNVHIWGVENSRATLQDMRDSPKVMCFVQFHLRKYMDHFSFFEKSVNDYACLDMLELWLLPQLQEDSDDLIL